MIILSLDASTTSTGYAVFDAGVLIEHGAFRPTNDNPKDRIEKIYKDIKGLMNKYKFDDVYIEDVPLSASINKRVAENLLLLQGCILSLCFDFSVRFTQMEPSNWRRLCGLNSSKKRDEQKESAIKLVNEKFGFDYVWVDSKTDSKTGHSDICEAILIGIAGMNK